MALQFTTQPSISQKIIFMVLVTQHCWGQIFHLEKEKKKKRKKEEKTRHIHRRNWSKYSTPQKFTLSTTSTDKSTTSAEDFESALVRLGPLFTCFFCPLSRTSLLHRAHTHRDMSFVCSVSPFLQRLLKLKGHRVGRRENRVEKWCWGEKKEKKNQKS